MQIGSAQREVAQRFWLFVLVTSPLLMALPTDAHSAEFAAASPTTTASASPIATPAIPDRQKFEECWKADFTESETFTQLKNSRRYAVGREISDRRDVVTTPISTSYVFCFEKDGRGALVVNGSLVPMVRPKDELLYDGDPTEVNYLRPPIALYAEWIRPSQPTKDLLIRLDKKTKKVSATLRTEDGKTRYKASSMLGTAALIEP